MSNPTLPGAVGRSRPPARSDARPDRPQGLRIYFATDNKLLRLRRFPARTPKSVYRSRLVPQHVSALQRFPQPYVFSSPTLSSRSGLVIVTARLHGIRPLPPSEV